MKIGQGVNIVSQNGIQTALPRASALRIGGFSVRVWRLEALMAAAESGLGKATHGSRPSMKAGYWFRHCKKSCEVAQVRRVVETNYIYLSHSVVKNNMTLAVDQGQSSRVHELKARTPLCACTTQNRRKLRLCLHESSQPRLKILM